MELFQHLEELVRSKKVMTFCAFFSIFNWIDSKWSDYNSWAFIKHPEHFWDVLSLCSAAIYQCLVVMLPNGGAKTSPTFPAMRSAGSTGSPGTERLPRAVVEQLRLVHLAQLDELSELRSRIRSSRQCRRVRGNLGFFGGVPLKELWWFLKTWGQKMPGKGWESK